jgi:TatD DNase family protein
MSGPSAGEREATSRPPLIDTHAHIQDRRFGSDREAVVDRALAAGLRAIVCVGYDLETSHAAVELAGRHEAVFAAVGIHPNDLGDATEADWDEVQALARHDRVVAIGETGLDNYRDRTPPALQERWFERHLELAAELGKPVVVHNREADRRTVEMLSAWSGEGRRAVMHCFAGDEATLERCLELETTISIAGQVTFRNAEPLRRVASLVPPERLVVETDCPYLTPEPRRGKRNEPAYVEHTARFLAELRDEPFDELARQTTRNAAALFRLPLSLGVAA